MCGIIGAYWREPHSDRGDRLQKGISMLSHRGPNDSGSELFPCAQGGVALGHTRLSIIDLSPGGHQPMHSVDGKHIIVFNGEIYNYKELRTELKALGAVFRTASDTEVLLAAWIAWGRECLPKLKGMFAFTVWNTETETMTCVRDAFGIKPLFYHMNEGFFAFASEIPALLTLLPQPPSINLQRAYDYLFDCSYDNVSSTFLAGVSHLLPGHILTCSTSDLSSLQTERWWRPEIKERTDLSFDEAAAQLRTMFLENVRLHLRSDVPLGAALSGGLDSSAVVCVMRHLEPEMPIHTFSFIAEDPEVNEERWADMVNSHVGAIPHKILVTSDELAEDLDDMILVQGEPFGTTSIYAQYRVFKLARESGITVTLDGQGADELLAGYFGYPDKRMLTLLDQGRIPSMLSFLNKWGTWPGRSRKHALANLISGFIPNALWSTALRTIGRNPEPEWLDVDYLRDNSVEMKRSRAEWEHDAKGRRLVAWMRKALAGHGLAALLRHGDRNAMRWSIESRVPFLTTDMAEFLLSLPEEYLLSQEGETKHIFRAAMRGIVPEEILDRKDKIGFATPEQKWLRTLGNKTLEWMDAADELPFLKAEESKAEVKAIIGGEKPFSSQAWRLINLCRWAQIINLEKEVA